MELFLAKQGEIERRQAEVAASYPARWSQIIAEWSHPSENDCAWLMYSANYLLRTAGVRWGIDPLRLKHRLPKASEEDFARDLRGLSFVVLTHEHGDHLDIELLRALRNLPIRWIVPEAILQQVIAEAGLPEGRVTIPQVLQPIEIQGIKIVPFEGLHWETPASRQAGVEAGELKGVPSMGYLAEFGGKRWLFPGDTRTYEVAQLPDFGPVDGVFAHLWLGRGCALLDRPPQLDAFCRFYINLKPGAIVVTHLEEFGRQADDYWDGEHFRQVSARIRDLAPGMRVTCAVMGDRVYF